MSLITASNVRFRYSSGGPWIIDDVSLSIEPGASVGIVGESGSGKSTLIRLLNGMLQPQEGTITASDRDVTEWAHREPKNFRRYGQMIFQSPRKSFDPRMRLGQSVSEPLRSLAGKAPSRGELEGFFEGVGLAPEMLDRYPHQLSGGQLQRVSIARALSVGPTVLYADEPTSALDVSVQARVLNLLMDTRAESDITLVMVSHDLAVVARVCDHIIVMRSGQIVEQGPTVELLSAPQNEYTADLIAAARAVSLTV